jgi:hypothetical protein
MSDEPEDDVVEAIRTLMSALKPLDQDARVHVLDFVLKRFGISLTAGPAPPSDRTDTPNLTPASHNLTTQVLPVSGADIRTFAAEKSPKTISHRVAVIGYYLAHLAPTTERRDYLVADDIKPYFIQAGFELPTAPANVTLANAKNAGYLNALDRGRFKLNAVGHNLVAHKLPSHEAGQTERRRKTRRKAKE